MAHSAWPISSVNFYSYFCTFILRPCCRGYNIWSRKNWASRICSSFWVSYVSYVKNNIGISAIQNILATRIIQGFTFEKWTSVKKTHHKLSYECDSHSQNLTCGESPFRHETGVEFGQNQVLASRRGARPAREHSLHASWAKMHLQLVIAGIISVRDF